MRKVTLALACSFALIPLVVSSVVAQPKGKDRDKDRGPSQTCASRVTAKGGPSLVQILAKSKARSAWSDAVRKQKRLGDDYATWKNAKDSKVDCSKDGRRHVCRASGRPCKA